MQTGRLYYEDPHLAAFTARVLSCEEGKGGYAVTLDATAFYPEGGGQAGDTGTLNGIRVLDTREREEQVIHLCEKPLEPGTPAEGIIDYDLRFRRMQQHSGEHIVSGILHRRYGCHNTGFHMGSTGTTIDFDAVIPEEDLPQIEAEANRAVWQNLPVRCWYPSEAELAQLSYRTKKTLPWPVRIVEIPGYDRCACCGTHVQATGEVGLIKLFSSVNFRGGSRIEMACGSVALEILNTAYAQNRQVGQAFSAKMEGTGAAARRMNEQCAELKFRLVGLERRIFGSIAEGFRGAGDVVFFEEGLDGNGLRELTEAIAARCGGRAAVFSGSDAEGYGYCLAGGSEDLRPLGKQMTAALNGRGGGKPNFQQGRVLSSRTAIEDFFANIFGSK